MEDFFAPSEEELAFMDEEIKDAERTVKRKEKDNFPKHKLNKKDTIKSHYCAMLHISEEHSEKYFKGLSIPLMKTPWRHDYFGPGKGRKPAGIFPEADDNTLNCIGEGCLVCQRLEPYHTKLEDAKAANDPERVKMLSWWLNGAKAKKKKAWTGVTLPGPDPEKDDPKENLIEVWEFSDYYYQDSVQKLLLDLRGVDIDDWTKAQGKALKGMSKEKKAFEFLKQNKPLHPKPWHPVYGYVWRLIKSGPFNNAVFKMAVREPWPYNPYLIKELFERRKAGDITLTDAQVVYFKKLFGLAKTNYTWLMKQFEEGLIPDLEHHYGKLTADEQRERLNVKEIDLEAMVKSNDSMETAINKVATELGEDLSGDLDLDGLEDTPEVEVVVKKKLVAKKKVVEEPVEEEEAEGEATEIEEEIDLEDDLSVEEEPEEVIETVKKKAVKKKVAPKKKVAAKKKVEPTDDDVASELDELGLGEADDLF